MSEVADPERDLLRRARAAVRAGRAAEAARCYEELLRDGTEHAEALTFLGRRAFESGDLATSTEFADRALRSAPERAALWRNRAGVHLAAGRAAAAAADLRRALELEPASLLAALELGTALAADSDTEGAVRAWRRAMRLEPRLADADSASQLPGAVSELAAQARRGLRGWLYERQISAITRTRARHPRADLTRIERAVRIFAGLEPPAYNAPDQRPSFFLVPDLTASPFFERDETSWLRGLEDAAEVVREECLTVLDSGSALSPYVTRDPGGATDWSALVGAPSWSSFHLYKDASRQSAHTERCPRTTALLDRLPVSRLHDVPNEAFLSVLQPGAHIPPHFGLSNAKAVVHLGLVVPERCHLRAGTETRRWRAGEAWVFDDSFEHEARNDDLTQRAVFIFEVWNPRLSAVEIEALTGVFDAMEDLMRM